MSGNRSHYEVLGVATDATKEQIRRAYRAAARRLHPDTNPSPDAEAKFREVALAYETLRDTTRRREYDARLDAARLVDSEPGRPHFSWTNIASEASIAWAEEARRERATELDEMYDAFFGPKKKKNSKRPRGE